MNYCPNCGKKLETWLSDYSGWGAYTKCACGKCYEHVCGDWGAPDTDTPCSEKYMKEQLLKVRSYIPEEKLAFYFGTFNPIHNGHLAVMNAVKDFGYTPVLIPSYDSPWKKDLKDSFGLRCAMIAQVTSRFDTLEKDLGTPSYSDQTVWNLRSMYGLSEIPFVIGYDAFAEIDKWQDSEDLKKKCRFLLVPRLIENESEMLEQKADEGWKFEIINMPCVDISSSEIRNKVANGETIKNLVPDKVEKMIEIFDMYKEKINV